MYGNTVRGQIGRESDVVTKKRREMERKRKHNNIIYK